MLFFVFLRVSSLLEQQPCSWIIRISIELRGGRGRREAFQSRACRAHNLSVPATPPPPANPIVCACVCVLGCVPLKHIV